MQIGEVLHAPWTCRWGQFPEQTRSGTEPAWVCCQPEVGSGTRVVGASDCRECPLWELKVAPPCPAIGWSDG